MHTTRPLNDEGTNTANLFLFIIILTSASKSQKIFKLTSLCHIAIRIEDFKAQTFLKHCYSCQQLDHVWVNCKQPLSWMVCGAITVTRNSRERALHHGSGMTQVGRWRGTPSLQLSRLKTHEGRDADSHTAPKALPSSHSATPQGYTSRLF